MGVGVGLGVGLGCVGAGHRDARDVIVELLLAALLGWEEHVAADEDEARLGVPDDLRGTARYSRHAGKFAMREWVLRTE